MIKTKKFCPLPWTHLQVNPDGDVRACCISQAVENTVIGNINTTSVIELWNADRMKQLRQSMMLGTSDPICEVCDRYEEAGLQSKRVSANTYMTKVLTNLDTALDNTDDSGHCSVVNLEYWDFRFSNFCNYKCRTCGPEYSSTWTDDAQRLGWLPLTMHKTMKPISWLEDVDARIALLAEHIKDVKEIYFAGGEPLIMEEHFRVLDMLIEAGKTDVLIRYNTNMSSLKYKGKDLIEDYWSKFSNILVSGSFDAVGEQAEYIRSGTKWSTLDANIRRLVAARDAGIIELMFNVTVSNLNVFYLEDIFNYFVDVGAATELNKYKTRQRLINFNVVFAPEHFCIQNLPASAKTEVRQMFAAFDQRIKTTYGVEYSMLTELYPILDGECDTPQIRQFKGITHRLDSVRGESIAKVLPRLWKHYEQMPLSAVENS